MKKICFAILLLSFCLTNIIFAQGFELSNADVVELQKNLEIAKANPQSAAAFFELAMTYAHTGLVLQGFDALKKVDQLDRNYASKVIAKYEPLTKKYPDDWKNWFKLAFGYFFANKKDKARDCFKVILRKYPDNVCVMGYLALVIGEEVVTEEEALKKKNTPEKKIKEILNPKIEEVINLCKKGLSIDPDVGGIHFLLGQAYLKKGDFIGFTNETLIALRIKSEADKYLKENELY
ncbi:MAG: tetratricopeptide repeat protein [Candidatus Margulisiibacteriota bacterium]|jgi:tetratricopeptide (TPR) repeat protein